MAIEVTDRDAKTAGGLLNIQQFIRRILGTHGTGESRHCGCPDFLQIAKQTGKLFPWHDLGRD